MKQIRRLLLILVLSQAAVAEFTIHVLSPWKDTTVATMRDSLRMSGNAEVGYYPGSGMVNEGGGWFYYNYQKQTRTGNATFRIRTWKEDTLHKVVEYGRTLRIDSLFMLVPVGTEDIWVVLNPDTTKFPKVYTAPPNGKVIYILNPWPENSPKMRINNGPAMQMRLREDLCGWYKYYYAGPSDSLRSVIFTDYFSTQKYTMSGLASGAGIDLRESLEKQDTVYILPRPFPAGVPSLTSTFPGRLGDCSTRKVSGIFRDWIFDDISFFKQTMGKTSGGRGMVMPTLTGPDWKPKIKTGYTGAPPLETWFNTVTLPNGQKNDTCIDLMMVKGYDGRWTFDSDNTGGFFPLDEFYRNEDEVRLFDRLDEKDKTGKYRNFHFTMEMHMQFIYREGQGLEFNFRGDDDVWIYVNNILAIDLGGLNDTAKGSMQLDKRKSDLKLVNGETYNLDIFFAERNTIGSNLLIRTSMDLRNSGELYYKEKPVGPGTYEYTIWEQKQSEGNDCGLTRLTDGEQESKVDFYIEGPQFPEGPKQIPAGVHYNGITVDPSGSRVTIDSAKISGLKSGDYRITFISVFNKDRSGYLTFSVAPIPDHLDIMPDSMKLDLKNDAVFDFINLGIEQDSLLFYTVIRDIYGTYLENGNNLTWTSRDEKVVTIEASLTDMSKAMVTKVGEGNTWIIVRRNGLKSDSVLIRAEAKPDFPLVSSAVMKDSRGDQIPDLLQIALSDTFKTGQTLKSVVISYNGKTYTILSSDCQISEKTITVPFTTLTGVDGKPAGSVTINMDVKGKEKNHTGKFIDGVGPALIAAELLEIDEGEPEVLFLTFSEPVYPATLNGEQLLLIKDGTTDTASLNIYNVNGKINDSTYSVTIAHSATIVRAGDKLRLVPGNTNGAVSDLNDNHPHSLNKPVAVTFRKGAAPIHSAWYKDVDADGIIDSLVIHFKRPVEKAELDMISVTWNLKTVQIDPSKFSQTSDSLISIPVRGTAIDNNKIATAGAMSFSQTYKNAPTMTRSSPVIDSAAPVLVLAKLMLGGFNNELIKESDTLQVNFSEAVQFTDPVPFLLLSSGTNDKYKFQTTSPKISGTQSTFIVSSIDPTTISPAKGDSIWINVNAKVSDLGGVMQVNELNHRVILEVRQPPTDWFMQIGPNPVKAGGDEMIIKIRDKKNANLSPFTAKIKIFDQIGNVIVDASFTVEDRAFVYKWNGSNKKGRSVGAGTYLSIVNIYEGDARVWGERKNIGVKKNKN